MKCKVFTATEIGSVLDNLIEAEGLLAELSDYGQQLVLDAIEVLEGGVDQEGFGNDSV
jgi:hypothetical protein